MGSEAFPKINGGDYENGDYTAAIFALLVVLVAPLQLRRIVKRSELYLSTLSIKSSLLSKSVFFLYIYDFFSLLFGDWLTKVSISNTKLN